MVFFKKNSKYVKFMLSNSVKRWRKKAGWGRYKERI